MSRQRQRGGWSPQQRVATFREKAKRLFELPLTGSMTLSTHDYRDPETGQWVSTGTAIDEEQLELFILRARLFSQKHDPTISLETMDRVIPAELERNGRADFAVDWRAFRGQQRNRRRAQLRQGAGESNVVTLEGVADLALNGNTFHLDGDKAATYRALVDAGLLHVVHHALVQHLHLLTREVREILALLDGAERHGVRWSTEPD